jgi:S1-C subfamily serine protease
MCSASNSRAYRAWLAALALLMAAGAASAQRASTGTGFFITEDGYFITCFHVVVNSGQITLRNLKGDTFEARAIAVDKVNDLALLKVEVRAEGRDGVRFKPLPLGASGAVRRGASIVTMGFPNITQQGIEPKVTDGIINSFSGANNDARVFQISAPIQTGNSGGPLITMDGNVIGVVASKLDAQAMARQTGDIPQNVNYAIKSQYVIDMLDKVAEQIPAVRNSLAQPLKGEKARVADVVPALEDAVALVLAAPANATQERAPQAAPGRAPENGSQSQPQGGTSPRTAPGAPFSPPVNPQGSPPAQAEPAPPTTPDERQQRMGRMVAEYRQLQQQLNTLTFDELTLINQANMLRMLLRFDQGGPVAGQRQADLTTIQRRLDDIGTKKAEAVKRMNELSVEYRQLQQGAQGNT